jgi:hypothetical protein
MVSDEPGHSEAGIKHKKAVAGWSVWHIRAATRKVHVIHDFMIGIPDPKAKTQKAQAAGSGAFS